MATILLIILQSLEAEFLLSRHLPDELLHYS